MDNGTKGEDRDVRRTIYGALGCSRSWIEVVRVNAMSTRVRRFSEVGHDENRSMSVIVGMENARNQRLGAQVIEMPKLLESLEFWLIT